MADITFIQTTTVNGVTLNRGQTATLSSALASQYVNNGSAVYSNTTLPPPYVNNSPVPQFVYSSDGKTLVGIEGPDGTVYPVSSNASSGIPLVKSNNPLLLKWANALRNVKTGLGNAKLLMVGDSTMAGNGASGIATGYANNDRAFSPPVQVAQFLNKYGINAIAESIFGFNVNTNTYLTYDNRFVNGGTGWTFGVTLNSAFKAINTAVNGATFTFTPTTAWDTMIVYYAQAGTQGTFSYAVDGGSATSINANGANAIGAATINAGTPGLHSVLFTKTNASGNYILGFRVYNSIVKAVDIIQMAIPGGKTTDVAASVNAWDGINEITALAPDLMLMDLVINDWLNAVTVGAIGTAGSTADNTHLMAQAALATGNVIITSGYPSKGTDAGGANPTNTVQRTYVTALQTVASTDGCQFTNTFDRWVSWTASQGRIQSDGIHPNATYGYPDGVQCYLNDLIVL